MTYVIEQISTSELTPYARNARTHSEEQLAQISASIKEFGFNNPVLIDNDNGIIAGHGRVMAADALGLKDIPCIRLKHLSDEQKRAYIIADNQLALNAGWNPELLKLEITDLIDADFNVDLLGFSDAELSDILGFDEPAAGLTDEDEAPEVEQVAITKTGDIWVLGKHRVMCGDSTSIDAVDMMLKNEKASLVFTDPPYGVEYQSNKRVKTKKFDVLDNDDVVLDITPIINMFSDGWVFIWTTWKVIDKWINNTSGLGYPSNMIVWHKGGGGIGDLKKTFVTDYEIALVFNRGAELLGKRIGSVWSINKDGSSSYVHPTQKPVALAVEAIDKTTNKNFIVLDLFGGSGSTLIACEKTGRQARLMELDPKYCDVIVKRWQNFTGLDAVLESTGETFNKLAGLVDADAAA